MRSGGNEDLREGVEEMERDFEFASKCYMLQVMHFNDRELKCENCEDYLEKLCSGHKFKTVEDCMIDKAKNTQFEAYGNLSDLS
jgi:hypothetical protein